MRLAPVLLALLSLVACKDKEEKKKAAAPAKAGDAGPAAEPDRPSVPLPADPAALLPLDQKVKKGVLPNGMTYFIRANKEPALRGEFRLVVNAGSFHEDDDQRGLAHFVEHMAFNGTKSFPKTELVSKLQQLGVRFGPHINAMTTFDETVYKLAVPTDKPESVDLTLQILREWAGDVTFLPADIDAERGVVLAEERDKLGAEMRLAESAIAQLFAGTRYANRLPIGLPAIIKKSKPDTLVRFYKDWYRPDNMAIIAVGDFDPAAIEKSIVERFGSLPKAEAKRAQPDRTMPPRKEMMFFGMQDKELPVAAVAVGQLVPARPHGSMNDLRREYVEGIAGLMLTKRLEEAKKKGDARYLVAGGGPAPLVRAAEAFGMFAAVKPEEMREGLEDVLAELERARRHGFTAGEAKRAADELISKMKSSAKEAAAGKEASEELAEELTRHFLTGEAVAGRDLELSIVKHFAATTKPEEMAAVISEMMTAKDLVMAAVAPAGKPLLSREDAAAELGRLPQKQLVAYTDVKSTKPLMAAPPAPGTVTAEKTHAEVGVTEWTLSNGARVFLKPTRFKADEILLRASSPGGFSLASLDSLKKTRVAHDLVRLGGLGEFDSVELEKILAGRDVEVQPFIDDLEEGLVASSSVDDVEVMLQLVNLSFTAPRLDKKAFEIWRESTLQEVRLARNKPAVRFLLRLEPLLANNDPRVLHWTEATVNGFDLDASHALYVERMQDAGDFRFVIVGSFELAAIKPLVLKYIGSLADRPRSESFALHAWPTHKKKQRLQVRDGKDERASLTVHFKRELAVDSVTVADRAAWSMFGEAMELELLELFREQMGDTYTVSATTGIAGYYQYATLSIGLSCAPDRAGKLEKLALAEIERMVSKGVGATYFDKARQAAIKELETSLENNQFWADRLTRQLFDGQPLADIPGRKKVLEGLTAEEVTRTAQRFVDPAVPVVGVHLPKR